MKIIDTTTYFEERMMMELRFNILDPYVDNFIVCEARFSHSGKDKDINFNKKDLFFFEPLEKIKLALPYCLVNNSTINEL